MNRLDTDEFEKYIFANHEIDQNNLELIKKYRNQWQ